MITPDLLFLSTYSKRGFKASIEVFCVSYQIQKAAL